VKTLLGKDYVLLSLDTAKHENGKAVIEKLRAGHAGGGIPWMVILDGNGKELVTGDGPQGNIGCPVQPDEIAWFRTMLERTKKRLQPADLDVIERHNKAFAERWLGKRKQ